MALIAVVGLLAYAGWRWFFPNDERLIRKLLAELAEAATIRADEAPLARVNNTGRLTALFHEAVEIRIEIGRHSTVIRGRDDLFKLVMSARANYGPARVEFLDARVQLAADHQSATVLVAARIHGPALEEASFQELRLRVAKTGRKWLIRQVETYRSLEM